MIFMISGTCLSLLGVIWVCIVARSHLREAIEISQKEKSGESLLAGNNPNEGDNDEERQRLLGRAQKS